MHAAGWVGQVGSRVEGQLCRAEGGVGADADLKSVRACLEACWNGWKRESDMRDNVSLGGRPCVFGTRPHVAVGGGLHTGIASSLALLLHWHPATLFAET